MPEPGKQALDWYLQQIEQLPEGVDPEVTGPTGIVEHNGPESVITDDDIVLALLHGAMELRIDTLPSLDDRPAGQLQRMMVHPSFAESDNHTAEPLPPGSPHQN